jgi:hypothetical protein
LKSSSACPKSTAYSAYCTSEEEPSGEVYDAEDDSDDDDILTMNLIPLTQEQALAF